MSALFEIEIIEVNGTKCIAALAAIHPDQFEIPTMENVGFQIVLEAYSQFGPFPDHPWKSKMDKWNAYMHREEVPISEEDYEKYDSGEWDLPSDCSGLGFHDEKWFLLRRENNYELVRAANNEICGIKLEELESEDEMPSGRLHLETFEPELFAHLRPGMTWRSSLYDRSAFM